MTTPVLVRPVAPVGSVPGRRRDELRVLLAVCLGTTMLFFQITASASALGAIQEDLRASPTALIWIPSAYTLAVAALVLSAGTLGSRHGRWRLFRLGVLVMIAGSLTSVVATSTGLVIVGQLASGVGGALILPNSLAILGTAFPDPQRRTEAITAWAAASGIGLAIGPLAAGELLAHLGWHAAFASTPVLGALTLAVTVRSAPEAPEPGGRLDLAGQLVAVVTISALVCALIQGGQTGYGSPGVVGLWTVAAVGAVAFVLVEHRSVVPMLDLRLFSVRAFIAVLLVGAVLLFGFSGVTILLVLFYERVQHLRPWPRGGACSPSSRSTSSWRTRLAESSAAPGSPHRSRPGWCSAGWQPSASSRRTRAPRTATRGRCWRCSAPPAAWSPRRARRPHWPASPWRRPAWPLARSPCSGSSVPSWGPPCWGHS